MASTSANDFNIRGKLAVITGAGDGIGKAIAIKFATEGCNLALVDINAQKLKKVCSNLQFLFPSLTIRSFVCDVSNEQKVFDLANSVRSEFKTDRIQILVNNVGISGDAISNSVLRANINSLQKMMDINVWSMIFGIRAFESMLAANVDNKEQCFVINTGSIASIETGFSMYSITKHAVIAFSETISEDFKRIHPSLNILISTLVPGFIKTNLSQSSAEMLGVEQKSDSKQERLVRMTQINDPMIVANMTYHAMMKNMTVIPTHLRWHEAVIKDRMNALLECKKDKKTFMRKAVRQRIANYKQKQSKL